MTKTRTTTSSKPKKSIKKSSLKKKLSRSNIFVQFQDETKVHPALKEYFGYCFNKASIIFRRIMENAMAPHGLQTHHLGILKVLELNGPTSQNQLGEELGIDKASMVKLVDLLEKDGWVKRETQSSDRRVKNISLTSDGAKRIKLCVETKTQVEKKFFQGLSDQEVSRLKELVFKLLHTNLE